MKLVTKENIRDSVEVAAGELLLPEEWVWDGIEAAAGELLLPEEWVGDGVEAAAGELLLPEEWVGDDGVEAAAGELLLPEEWVGDGVEAVAWRLCRQLGTVPLDAPLLLLLFVPEDGRLPGQQGVVLSTPLNRPAHISECESMQIVEGIIVLDPNT